MVVQHNLPAMNSHRQLGINNASTAKNLEKLSSGYRVNRAGDDAAGLAISEKMRGQIRGLDMATQNSQNSVSLLQTAEGGLNETHAVLQRMRELSVQSANGTYADEVDRENLNKEVVALKDELDRIASSTHYNGIKLLDGSMGGKPVSDSTATSFTAISGALTITKAAVGKELNGKEVTVQTKVIDGVTFTSVQSGDKVYSTDGKTTTLYASDGTSIGSVASVGTKEGVATKVKVTSEAGGFDATGKDVRIADKASKLTFQIGANGNNDQSVTIRVDSMSSAAIGSAKGNVASVSVKDREKAKTSIDIIDGAINMVSGTRADLGALQNRLEHTIDNLGTSKENLQAAESTIRDVDMAKEMMDFTKNNILSQASQAMLAQANVQPQNMLSLLR